MVIESSIVILRSTMFSKASLKIGISADESSRDADYTDVRKWLPQSKPDRRRRQCHKSNADEFSPRYPVPQFFMLSNEIRFLQVRRIPLLPEFGWLGRRLFDRRRRTHKQVLLTYQPRRLFQVRLDHVDHFIGGHSLR